MKVLGAMFMLLSLLALGVTAFCAACATTTPQLLLCVFTLFGSIGTGLFGAHLVGQD